MAFLSNKSLRFFLRMIEVFIALVIVLGGIAFWRLSVSPMNVDFLIPELKNRFIPKDSPFTLDIRTITLYAKVQDDGLLHLNIKDLSVLRPDGSVITDLPEIEMSYGITRILMLNYMPDTLTIKNALVQAIVDPEGNLYIQGQEGERLQETPNVQVGEKTAMKISDINGVVDYILSFRRLELEDAQIMVDNQKTGRQINMPNLNLLLEQQSLQEYALNAQAAVSIEGNKFNLSLDTTFNKGSRKLPFNIRFDTLNLSQWASLEPLLGGIKVPLKGLIQGELNLSKGAKEVRSSVEKLAFRIQNEKAGTVNLPAPLTNLYKIDSMMIQGAFSPELETLTIGKSELKTGQATASLDVDITGLGAFFETKDLKSIKTVLKSTVKNVKTEEVPNLWPSALGPDAHAWVKKNLSQGGISKADFTLYFTGDNLDDLFGDVQASGLRVDYLNPMAPVTDAVARVHLYPDTVEIFASAGRINNLELVKADLYLTQLQEKVSHAKVILSAKGPVEEAMSLIDTQPLGFAKDFGLNPTKTSGNAVVNATIIFPLIETLTVNQVKVNVDAAITNGAFPSPIDDVLVEGATLNLTVDNTALNVKGTAAMQGIPLGVEWAERFVETKTNKVQSFYHLTGTMSAANVQKYAPEADKYLIGAVPFTVDIQKMFKGGTNIAANLDLTAATVQLYPISFEKKAKVAANLSVSAALTSNKAPTAFTFVFNAPSVPIDVRGNMNLANGFSLWLDQVTAPGNNFKAKVIVDKSKNMDVMLSGKAWDMSKLFDMPYFKKEKAEQDANKEDIPNAQTTPPNLKVDMALDSLTMEEKKPLKFVQVKGERRGAYWRNLNIYAKGSTELSINFIPQTRLLKGECKDLGDLLTRLGFTSRFFGGQMRLDGVQSKAGGFTGDIVVRDFELKDPGFIIQAVTILGIVDGIRGKPLQFKRAKVPFEVTPNQTVYISDGYAYGTTLGVTFKGKASLGRLNMSGSVIPAYLINSLPGKIPLVGGLFRDGAGGGLMGVRYNLRGTAFAPAVTFDALSSVAPGALGGIIQDITNVLPSF